jgi:hypothetical protein
MPWKFNPFTGKLDLADTSEGGSVSYASAAEAKAATSTSVALNPDNLVDYLSPQALTDGASIAFNAALGVNASVTLGGNRTLANPTNLQSGQSGLIRIVQDGTGSRTLAYGANWKFPGGTAPTLTTAANAVDLLSWYYDGTTLSGNLITNLS